MKESISERIGRFVHSLTYGEIPEEVIEKAKTCMINGIGIGISCYGTEFAEIARRTIKAEESNMVSNKSATIFCDYSKVSVMGAAFANSCLFHGRTQEDTLGSSHAGTIVIPAVLAIAEREGNSGREVIEAVVAGYEVVGCLDSMLSKYTTPRGFRASSIFGIFGSVSAASKLFKLSEEETVNAVGLAAAFASGTVECFIAGTVEWRFEVGVACRDGILACLIAKNGAKASRTALEGKSGFLDAFANAIEHSEEIAKNLGQSWQIMAAGFKPYPVCYFNQTPVLAMLDIVTKHKIEPNAVEQIKIYVNPHEYHYPGMNYRGPFTTIGSTLMSAPFLFWRWRSLRRMLHWRALIGLRTKISWD